MLAVGFAAGPPADAVSALKPEEALKKALEQLDDMFRGRKWLKGGGCTGKGDWADQVGENPASNEDEGNSGRDQLQDSGLTDESQESEKSSIDEPGPCDTAHGVDGGDEVGGADKEGETVELLSTAYTGGLVHDWVRDEPFVRGGYSYPRIGFDENTLADAAASVNGSLFFAGEHTNTPTGMTVHAAIDSGERCDIVCSEYTFTQCL